MDNVKPINSELAVAKQQVTPQALHQAAQEGFHSVLNLRVPTEEGFLRDEAQQAEAAGLVYAHIPVSPAHLSEELATQVLAAIEQLPKPLLVHCASGMRASLMALLSAATQQGMTPDEAVAWAKQLGFDYSANPGLQQFFESYLAHHSVG